MVKVQCPESHNKFRNQIGLNKLNIIIMQVSVKWGGTRCPEEIVLPLSKSIMVQVREKVKQMFCPLIAFKRLHWRDNAFEFCVITPFSHYNGFNMALLRLYLRLDAFYFALLRTWYNIFLLEWHY